MRVLSLFGARDAAVRNTHSIQFKVTRQKGGSKQASSPSFFLIFRLHRLLSLVSPPSYNPSTIIPPAIYLHQQSVHTMESIQMESPPLNPLAITEDLTPLPTLKSAGDTSVHFEGQLSRSLRLHEDVRTGCGGQTWPAGMLMGKHLLRYQLDTLKDARM